MVKYIKRGVIVSEYEKKFTGISYFAPTMNLPNEAKTRIFEYKLHPMYKNFDLHNAYLPLNLWLILLGRLSRIGLKSKK